MTQTTDINAPVLSIAAAQKYLGGISRAGLYNLMNNLETVKIGGRRLVTRASLDRLIERSTVPRGEYAQEVGAGGIRKSTFAATRATR